MKTVHLKITGKVQGVFFRASAKEIAKMHQISGWVKNTEDDAVEAIITGKSESVDAFVSWCQKGPERAKVKKVKVTELELKEFVSFEVLR